MCVVVQSFNLSTEKAEADGRLVYRLSLNQQRLGSVGGITDGW